MKRQKQIIHFDDINQCHEAMGFTGRTDQADFHVFTIEETYPSTCKAMPPYTLRFYCITLLENSHDAILEINARQIEERSDTLAFQPPGHVSSWVRGEAQRGFILYFQPEFLDHYPISLDADFPFFSLNEMNVLPLSSEEKVTARDHLTRLIHTFTSQHPYRIPILQAQLLAFLFDCKGLHEHYHANQERRAIKPTLAIRFQQLVNYHILTHQSVQEYAELLHVTPNHLSQTVAKTFGRQANEIIADRLLLEAKKLLRYTDLTIAEIADYLGFEEPTHFGRFFKRHMSMTPRSYRLAPIDPNVNVAS